MATASPHRRYRAACPQCGAPVEFASAASASAVCSYCRSTLLREGEALRRIGQVGELFDDHSPLQLGARGTRQGIAFTLVGRLQYGYEGGTWNEWHALFDNARSAWLSEDNGAYVLAFDAPCPSDAPALDARLAAGQRVVTDGRAWSVASVVRAHLLAAEGELPAAPRLQGEFTVADLRNEAGEVATLDNSRPAAPQWSVGRSVQLAELRMQGLRELAGKTLGARSFDCPSCGAPLAPRLASTKSLACAQCRAVVDISGGVGAELAHYAQNNAGAGGLEPQIPLGSMGTFEALAPDGAGKGVAPAGTGERWQVVGYLERCDLPEDADEDTTYWREYLLHHPTRGFAFLVDTEEGWSWVRPITGAPRVSGERAVWEGVEYRLRWRYAAKVTWVQGEFYWRVQRDERAQVADYEGRGRDAGRRLSREDTRGPGGTETVWSAGATLTAAEVADAFGIAPGARTALGREPAPAADASPLVSDISPLARAQGGAVRAISIVIALLVLVSLLSECGDDECTELRATFGESSNEYRQCMARRGSGALPRTGGGSFGGWSGGGGHK